MTMLIMFIIHLCGSQGGLDHTGGVADKGEHRPVCRLRGKCSHDADGRVGAEEVDKQTNVCNKGAWQGFIEKAWIMMNQHCKGTWPGSTSSRVAPWVARTAAAIASITWMALQ